MKVKQHRLPFRVNILISIYFNYEEHLTDCSFSTFLNAYLISKIKIP